MDRAHRQELKHDKFIEQVGHTVEYAAEHRSQVVKWGIVAIGILLVGLGIYLFLDRQHSVRQDELRAAMRIQEAQVNQTSNDYVLTFPNQAEKDKAAMKAFTDLANKYQGKREAVVARYFLGIIAADQGKLGEAEKNLKMAADSGQDAEASQAKLSLAQLYASQDKLPDAEKLLRSLIEKPTIMVSKEQATIALARIYAKTKPADARKLLEPLRTERGAVSRVALTALSELPAAPAAAPPVITPPALTGGAPTPAPAKR